MLSALYHRNGHLETQSAAVNILSTSAGSRMHARMYWLMKNKEYSWSHCPNHLWIQYRLLFSVYMSSFLGVKHLECEAGQKFYLLHS